MKVTASICSPRSASVRSGPAARATPRYVIPFSFTKSGQHRGAEYPGPVVLSVPQAARSAAPTSGDSQQARDFRPIIDYLPFRNTFMPQRATPLKYDIPNLRFRTACGAAKSPLRTSSPVGKMPHYSRTHQRESRRNVDEAIGHRGSGIGPDLDGAGHEPDARAPAGAGC